MEEVRFYFDRNRAKRFLIGAGPLLIFGVCLKLFSRSNPSFLLGQGSIVGSALFFLGLGLIFHNHHQFRTKRPALFLSAEGIFDNTWRNGKGLVPWSRVASIKSLGKSSISVNLLPTDSPREPRIWDSYYVSVPKQESFDIDCRALGVSKPDLEAQLRAFLKSAPDAEPPG
jgi:hypothetical protein